MLYFGNPRGRLAIEASIVESDERVLRALKASQQSLNTIAAIGGQLWGAGTSFAGGIKFLGAILSLVRSQVDNDVELMLHGTIGETGTARSASAALRAGRYKIFRKPRRPSENSGDDLGIQFSIKPFSTPEIDTDVVVSLRLDSIHLELKQSAIPDYRQGVDANLNRARLIFDTTFGSGKHRNAYDFDVRLKNGQAGIGDFFNAGGREVYRGPWRMGVPFVMSMAVVNDQSELEALKGVISAGGVFSKSLAGEDLEDLIAGSTRALESMRSHLLEFLPKKVSVGKISGLIAAAGALPKESLKLPNFVALEVKSKTWSKIHFNLGSTRAGKALVTLGIKRV
jgi:hypothetical protein